MDTSTRDISTPFQETSINDSTAKSQDTSGKRSLFVLILLCSAQFMVVLDFSIVLDIFLWPNLHIFSEPLECLFPVG